MTNADVQNLMAQSSKRGRPLNDFEAINFLGAKELLERDRDNKKAQHVVEIYARYLATGVREHAFDEFMIGDFYTDEEKAAMVRL